MRTNPSDEVEIHRVTKILGGRHGTDFVRLVKAEIRKNVPVHARFSKGILHHYLDTACRTAGHQLDTTEFEDAFTTALADQRRVDRDHADLVASFAIAKSALPSKTRNKAWESKACDRFYETMDNVRTALKVQSKNTIIVYADPPPTSTNAGRFSGYLGGIRFTKIDPAQTVWLPEHRIAAEFTNIILYGHVVDENDDPFFSDQLLTPETIAMFLGQRAHVSVIGCTSDGFTRRLAMAMPYTSFIWTTWPFMWRGIRKEGDTPFIDAFNGKTRTSRGTLIDILSFGTSVTNPPV